MSAAAMLTAALRAVDWNDNVSTFLRDPSAVEAIAGANLRLAIWSRQFEDADKENPALCFIRELQVAGHHVAALAALAFYKPAAASMRAILETAMYYSYFRTHLSELSTLARDPKYFISKSELIQYHRDHTPKFGDLEQRLALVTRLDKWYSTVSAIIHGQLPGLWIDHTSLAEIKHTKTTLEVVVKTFQECVEIVHGLFLCTVGRELWGSFSSLAKKQLTAGLSGSTKAAFRLDTA